jgi:hypothetical protein
MWYKDTNVCEELDASFFKVEKQTARKNKGNDVRKGGKKTRQRAGQ